MSESPNSTTQKCYLSFFYKRTEFKAVSDTILISIDGEIVPSRLHTSRSGRHGERQYVVYNGQQYIVYDVQKSNLGNVYISIKLVRINECQMETISEWRLYSGKEIVTPIEKLPQWLQQILTNNQKSLPLFDYIYW